jgi:pimeloyl-ACP methyl ester carboxylesterase
MDRRPLSGAVLWAAALVACTACAATPVRVEPADPQRVHRELTANVLTQGRPSDRSRQLLERLALTDAFEKSPEQTLAALHRSLAPEGDQRRLFALAELSFHHAERSGDRRYYLMSAAYAYALLFPEPGEETLEDADPRLRLGYDLYNRGLARAAVRDDDGTLEFDEGSFELPIGSLEVEVPDGELAWADHRLTDLRSAADVEVKGLRNRYRVSGIGAPLSAELEVDPTAPGRERFIPGLRVAATLFLRFEAPRESLAAGRLRARVEIYTPDESPTVRIDDRDVTLEFETSSSLAATLGETPLWDFELAGFFSGAFRPLREAVETAVLGDAPLEQEAQDEGLLFLHPYRPGRIPVVLVHGTASSPGRWADLVNELENERRIWEKFQIWLFLYNTGNPIGYSGGLLRRSLERAVERLDPLGMDPALQHMVVIGHSQGGLLTKLTAIDGGDRFWSLVSEAPLEDLDLDDDVRETLRLSTFFTPEPFVKRVIFVCTPHRGSYLASFSLAGLVSDFVAMPSNLTQVMTELVTRNHDKLMLRSMARLPTSIDNMTPGNPFIQTLAATPVAPDVRAHSIIAVRGDGSVETGSDGVVRYQSAHVEGVDSELVVRSGHSAQGQPQAIREIRRILFEHAAEVEAERSGTAAGR